VVKLIIYVTCVIRLALFVHRPTSSAWSTQGGGRSAGGQASVPHRAAPVAPSRPTPSVPQRMAPSPTPMGNIPANLPPPLIPSYVP